MLFTFFVHELLQFAFQRKPLDELVFYPFYSKHECKGDLVSIQCRDEVLVVSSNSDT